MPQHYSSRVTGVGTPLREAYDGIPITPNDSVNLPVGPGGAVNTPVVGIYVGGAGNVAATTSNGVSVTFTAVPAGTTLDVCLRRVLATGTTATQISALYAAPL